MSTKYTVTITTEVSDDYMFEGYKIDTPDRVVRMCAAADSPEDNTFGHNLNGVYDIPGLIKEAHAAGKAGLELEIVTVEGEI